MLETGDVRILFSLPQMRNLGMTIELDEMETKLHVHLLSCTLLQLSTLRWTHCVGLDESCVTTNDQVA